MRPHNLRLILIDDGLSSYRRSASDLRISVRLRLLRSPLVVDSLPLGTHTTRLKLASSNGGLCGMSSCSGSVAAVLAS